MQNLLEVKQYLRKLEIPFIVISFPLEELFAVKRTYKADGGERLTLEILQTPLRGKVSGLGVEFVSSPESAIQEYIKRVRSNMGKFDFGENYLRVRYQYGLGEPVYE